MAPCPRYGHVMGLAGKKLVIFGGKKEGNLVLADTWALNTTRHPNVWEILYPYGDLPCGRVYASATTRDRRYFMLYGGRDQHGMPLGDTYKLEPLSSSGFWVWTRSPHLDLSKRYQHAAVFVNLRLHVFGGALSNTRLVDAEEAISVLDTSTGVWVDTSNEVMRCSLHAAASVGSRIYVYGGIREGNYFDTSKEVMRRSLHAAASVGSRIYVYGGIREGVLLDDLLISGELLSSGPTVPSFLWRSPNTPWPPASDMNDGYKPNFSKEKLHDLVNKVISTLLRPQTWEPPVDRKFFLSFHELAELCFAAKQIIEQEPTVLQLLLETRERKEKKREKGKTRKVISRLDLEGQTDPDRADILWEASSVSGLEIHRRDLDFNGWIFCCLGFLEAGRHSSSAEQSWVFGKSNGKQDHDIPLHRVSFPNNYMLQLKSLEISMVNSVEYPKNIHLIRGNHEAEATNTVYGFLDECIERIECNDGNRAFKLINDFFQSSSPCCPNREENFLCTRSDPTAHDSILGIGVNERGPHVVSFGPDRVNAFCERNDIDMIIRGHECVLDGFERFAQGKLITVFSATNYCGKFKNAVAILVIGRNLDVVPKLIHPLPPPISPSENVPDKAWIEVDRERPPTPIRGQRKPDFEQGSTS
ncbi:hypothetical protein F2Q69_00029774 [Brassica cretica]|uniref:Serine/threonine-protein phosphatase n=1 Tax=Brassica cretica TaxID=69181 RepID=A0A8S9SAD0_BRACR|nr:hypothetical protein F2Q69_00029774 [Brassica cretica]